ncbi:uncharacterized protein MKK02DRAFT_33103 [Dioszegia hungarica]|uniref:Uncharacterized protein n=1 Tax=Dioszegia hungarica TaxID=4972 RepID=A0AA38H8K8_9TREE|nr:uncharacterized protein MKK02DRAFT_33103 [Dioszegia hungarica]KAI9635750.1 hypothetical protein MKK02DRAFT_33103 [Dioszegia hungarica]
MNTGLSQDLNRPLPPYGSDFAHTSRLNEAQQSQLPPAPGRVLADVTEEDGDEPAADDGADHFSVISYTSEADCIETAPVAHAYTDSTAVVKHREPPAVRAEQEGSTKEGSRTPSELRRQMRAFFTPRAPRDPNPPLGDRSRWSLRRGPFRREDDASSGLTRRHVRSDMTEPDAPPIATVDQSRRIIRELINISGTMYPPEIAQWLCLKDLSRKFPDPFEQLSLADMTLNELLGDLQGPPSLSQAPTHVWRTLEDWSTVESSLDPHRNSLDIMQAMNTRLSETLGLGEHGSFVMGTGAECSARKKLELITAAVVKKLQKLRERAATYSSSRATWQQASAGTGGGPPQEPPKRFNSKGEWDSHQAPDTTWGDVGSSKMGRGLFFALAALGTATVVKASTDGAPMRASACAVRDNMTNSTPAKRSSSKLRPLEFMTPTVAVRARFGLCARSERHTSSAAPASPS